MRVGTRSVLFGAHAFWLHPFVVAAAWLKLFGFRTVECRSSGVTTRFLDPRLWLAFLVHDLGYVGKPNMDGTEGEQHPRLGAAILGALAGPAWHDFVLYHSRFLAKLDGRQPSLFCAADKLAIALEPSWLYLPRAWASGELRLYMQIKPREITGHGKSAWRWHKDCREYCRAIAFRYRDGEADTWT